jgi:iron complex outermembrane recepter protein
VSKTFSSPTWQVGAEWQVTPARLVYVNSSRGYKSGGYNLRAQNPAEFAPYNPETVTQEELGLKADWHPGGTALRTNLALYYQAYDNIQREEATVVNGGLVTTIVNAATATVKGIEADVTWLPIKTLELRAYWSFSDAQYSKWLVPNGAGGFSDYSNFNFSYAPKNSGGGSARKSFLLSGDAGTLIAGIDGYHQTKIQEQDVNVIPDGIAPAYTIGNLRFEWKDAMHSGISTAIYVRNFTNTKYYRSGTPIVGLGSTTMTLGEPLTYGLELHYGLKH